MSNDTRDVLELACVAIIGLSWVILAINRIRDNKVVRDIRRGREQLAYLDGRKRGA